MVPSSDTASDGQGHRWTNRLAPAATASSATASASNGRPLWCGPLEPPTVISSTRAVIATGRPHRDAKEAIRGLIAAIVLPLLGPGRHPVVVFAYDRRSTRETVRRADDGYGGRAR